MSETAGMEAAATGAEDSADTSTEVDSQSQGGDQGEGAPTGSEKAGVVKDVIAELQGQDLDKVVKVKINGKEQSMKVRDALKRVELGEGAQTKMQQAAQLRRQAEQIIQLAKSNPKDFFRQTGVDPYEFAEATLAEKYEMMNMSPEQKRLMELEKENKTFKERQEQEQKQRQEHEQTQAQTKMANELQQEIIEAWKDSGLPRSKYFAARISAEMLSSLAQKKAGMRDEALQAKEAAAIVKEQVTSELRDILLQVAKVDPGAAQQLLGDEMMKLLRDHDVRRVTGVNQATQLKSQQRPGNSSPASGKSTQNKPLSEREYDAYFRNLKT